MSRTLVDILIEKKKREDKYFKNYLFWAKEIKKEAERLLGKVRVIVFGSILRQSKNEVPRDIDILVISPIFSKIDTRGKIRAKIWEKIGINSPFEIHLISPKDYENWYSLFIKEKIEI